MSAELVDFKMNENDKSKALDAAIGQIEKAFGKGSVMKLGQRDSVVDIQAVSTGSLGLDIALGIGGFPKGRIIEIYGPESSGKTTLALHAVAEAQAKGGNCAFVDAEHALDPTYARKLGVNLDELLISQPDAGEQALKLPIRWCVPGRLMCWWLIRLPPWYRVPSWKARWATIM